MNCNIFLYIFIIIYKKYYIYRIDIIDNLIEILSLINNKIYYDQLIYIILNIILINYIVYFIKMLNSFEREQEKEQEDNTNIDNFINSNQN
jgi:large-conductance mechanosensitive channel